MIQQIGLFPHRTIAENIGTVPQLLGWEKERIAARTTELLELIGLDPELGDRYPAQLSGGQQQRVGVARALAADPLVMLMDEPFGAIDPINRERLQNEFLRLQAEVRKTVLFVTHDIDEAIKMGDRIAIMREGGKVAQYATPAELLMAPADEFVEDFVGADRALKRLALMRVSDIDLWEAPLADVGQPTAEVRAKLASPTSKSPTRCWSTASAARSAGSPSATSPPRPSRPGRTRRSARCSTATTSCATRSPTCSRARPSTRRWSTARAGSTACSRSRSSPSSSARRQAKTEEHSAVERPRMASPAPARRGRRSRRRLHPGTQLRHAALPGRPSKLFCFDWAGKTSTATRRRRVQHLELVLISVAARLRRSPSRSPCSPTAAAGCSHRCWPATGVLYTIPSIAFFFLLLPITGRGRDTAIIALSAYTLQIIYRNTIDRPRQRARRRSRTRPAAWA